MIDRRGAFYNRYGRRPRESGSGVRLFYDDDGRLVDRYERTLEEVRAAAAKAAEYAHLLSVLGRSIERDERRGELIFDRIAGGKFFERQEWNAHLLRQIAKRDNEIPKVMEDAAEEDRAFASR